MCPATPGAGGPASSRGAAIAISLLLWIAAPGASRSADIRFASDYTGVASFAPLLSANCVAAADINGDGLVDLLDCGSANGPIVLHRGLGAHRWATAESLNIAAKLPFTFAVADIDRDGRMDLVVAETGQVTTLLGNGSGTFQPRRVVLSGVKPTALLVDDLDGDGLVDLAAMDLFGPLLVARGTGDGGFTLVTVASDVGGVAYKIASGDLDGDGRRDLVVANTSGGTLDFVRLLPGLAAAPVVRLALPSGPFDVSTGDVNEDGVPDLAVACRDSSQVRVFRGVIGGPPAAGQVLRGIDSPSAVCLSDMDHDGHLDLATTSASLTSDVVQVQRGAGDGSFALRQSCPAGYSPGVAVVRDVDGDGRMDVVVGSSQAPSLSVLFGNGDGTLGANASYPTAHAYQDLVVGDVNQDGLPDVLTPGTANPGMGVHLENNAADLHPFFLTAAPTYFSLQHAELVDLAGHGVPDLAASVDFYDRLEVLHDDGAGHFAAGYSLPLPSGPAEVVIGDLDGDGRPDVACATASGIAAAMNTSTGVLATPVVSGFPAKILALADFNEDGFLDAVSANSDRSSSFSAAVRISLGQGDGRFVGASTLITGSIPSCVLTGDIDGDGHQDLAVAHYGGGTVGILLGRGDGTFVARSTLAIERPVRLALADLNRDGRLDLAMMSGDGPIMLWAGVGDGTFSNPFTVGAPTGRALRIFDVDRDGRPDLVLGQNWANSEFRVYLNRTAIPTTAAPPAVSQPTLRLEQVSELGNTLRVRLALPDARPAVISVFDVSGRVLARSRLDRPGEQEVSMALGTRLLPGVHWVRLQHASGVRVKRFVTLR